MAKNYSNTQKGLRDEEKNTTSNSTSQERNANQSREKNTNQNREKNTTSQNQQKDSAEDNNRR